MSRTSYQSLKLKCNELSISCYVVMLLRYNVITLLRYNVITLLRCYVITLLYYYVIIELSDIYKDERLPHEKEIHI